MRNVIVVPSVVALTSISPSSALHARSWFSANALKKLLDVELDKLSALLVAENTSITIAQTASDIGLDIGLLDIFMGTASTYQYSYD
jgi:hypothetical protein